jgi:hypothetical protein
MLLMRELRRMKPTTRLTTLYSACERSSFSHASDQHAHQTCEMKTSVYMIEGTSGTLEHGKHILAVLHRMRWCHVQREDVLTGMQRYILRK